MLKSQVAPHLIPLYSPFSDDPIRLLTEAQATKLIAEKRGRLRSEPERSILLVVEPGDENDPRVFDLFGKMMDSRETVRKEIVDPWENRWIYQHKRTGEELEAWREIAIEELRFTGTLPKR